MTNISSNPKFQDFPSKERKKADESMESQDGIAESKPENPLELGYERTKDEVSKNDKQSDCSDLGEYYIGLMQEAMEKWYSKPREGYHVSDICLCARQRVFREIDRLPIDAKTVSIYAAGKASHEAVQSLYRSDKRTFEIEKYVEHEDIQGSVDIYDRRHNTPLEFKTTRASNIQEPKIFHVEQLKYYCSILDAEQGYLIYQLLMHFGDTPFKAFRIRMNPEERKDQRDKLVKEINSLKRAMEARDPSLARSVYKDPAMNWLCKDCPYMLDCKKIQQDAAVAA